MPRDLVLDFRVGGGSVPEIAQGIVRIWGTEVRPNGPSVVVTTETTLKLSDGKATLANAQTSGTGPLYEWAYIIQVEPFHGRNYRFYVAIPDGTGPVNLVDLPKLNPYTGEGFYLDIEEWEALYGALPSRVDALETSQATQDGKITTLEARPIGNTTMRVDTTVGTRVFITDGVTERMISGDTGLRNIHSLLDQDMWVPSTSIYLPTLQRVGDTVYLQAYLRRSNLSWEGTQINLYANPPGFGLIGYGVRGYASDFGNQPIYKVLNASNVWGVQMAGIGVLAELLKPDGLVSITASWQTADPWPTDLPGTPA